MMLPLPLPANFSEAPIPTQPSPLHSIQRRNDFVFCLDVAPPEYCAGEELFFEGWCFQQGSSSPISLFGEMEQLEGTDKSQDYLFEIQAEPYERADVREAFLNEPGAEVSGFLLRLPLTSPGRYRISLVAYSVGASPVVLDTREVIGIPPQFLMRPIPMAESKREDFRFHLDIPHNHEAFSKLFPIHGWCVRKDGQTIRGIRVRSGEKISDVSYGLLRTDVMNHLAARPGSFRAGFEGLVEVESLPATITVEAEVGGNWLTVESLGIKKQSIGAALISSIKRTLNTFPGSFSAQLPLSSRLYFNLLTDFAPREYGNFFKYTPKDIVADTLPPPSAVAPNELPKVVVVTPSYNQAHFLKETMQSVLTQEGVRCDYIVMDGGSSDESREIIRSHERRLFHWVSERDRGQSDAIAKGFQRAIAEPDDIYAYLNSDDLFLPGVLRFVAEFFHTHPEVDVLFGHRIVIDQKSKEVSRWFTPLNTTSLLPWVDLLPQETAFWRKRIYDRVSGVDPSFRFAMDWDLFVRFLNAGARMKRVPYFLGAFRVHQDSKTMSQGLTVGAEECKRIRAKLHGEDYSELEVQRKFFETNLQGAILRKLWSFGVRV